MAVLESIRVRRVQFEVAGEPGPVPRPANCEVRAHARPAGDGRARVLLVARFFEGEPNPPFRLEVAVEGLFRLTGGEDPGSVARGAGPAAVYPYLRDEVARVTLRGGVAPVLLPPLGLAPPVEVREDVN